MKNSYIIFCAFILISLQNISSEDGANQPQNPSVIERQRLALNVRTTDVQHSPKTPRAHTPAADITTQHPNSPVNAGGGSKPSSPAIHSPLKFTSRLNQSGDDRTHASNSEPTRQTATEIPMTHNPYLKLSRESAESLFRTAHIIQVFNQEREKRVQDTRLPVAATQATQLERCERLAPRPVDTNSMRTPTVFAGLTGASIAIGATGALIKYSHRIPHRGITDPTEITGYIKAGIGVAATVLVIGVVCFGATRIRTMIGGMKDAIEHGFQANSLLRSQANQRLSLLEEQLNRISEANNRTNKEIQEDITRLSGLVQQAVDDISNMLKSINGFQIATQEETSALTNLASITADRNSQITAMKKQLDAHEEKISALEKKPGRR